MSRPSLRLLLTLIAGLALLAVPGIAASAQDATPAATAAHPSHIHEGTCATLNPNPAYPLNDVAAVAPDAPADAVETATTTVDVSLDDLMASPYAINVHESAENIATYIACGDIAGPVADGTLLVALREQNGSGYSGIAVLATNAAGGTDVTVFLAQGESTTAAAAPAAMTAHPSHIHVGTCANLDPNPAYPLNDVAAVAADAPAGAVEVAHSTIDTSLNDLLANPYAVNVHESAENISTYIACGDVAGPVVNGLLLIPLHAQNGSGYSGIAALATNDAGGTNVSVYLAPPAAAGAATPAAAESTPAAAATTPQAVAIDIKDFAFSPQTLTIPVGTTVTWTNQDVTAHTTTAKDKTWDSNILQQGATFSYTFDTPGTYDYICSLHPNMTAQIVVTGQ
jgi:plastocyanin